VLKILRISRKDLIILLIIFIAGFGIRMINFSESLYFGYDEARDAYDSQNIYLQGDLKLSGPPASAFKGINHGPIYLYFIGPLFLLGKGDPYYVSVIFRFINSTGVLLVFLLGSLYFGRLAGIFAALIYATSYEQYVYAIFTGNPALSNMFWPVLFIGAGIVCKYPKRRILGIFLMFLSASFIAQFDLILLYSFVVLGILLYLLRTKLKGIRPIDWIKVVTLGLTPVASYPLAELRNNFLGLKTLFSIINHKGSFLSEGESSFAIFWKNVLGLVRDNIMDFSLSSFWITLLSVLLILFLLVDHRKSKISGYVAIWILSISFLLITRGFMPYYSYAGVGIGVIVGFAYLLSQICKKYKLLGYGILVVTIISNISQVIPQSKKALIVEIKAQPGMKLSDEIKLIDKTYSVSKGEGFTIRTTTMPYKVQTVWAYLYNWHGLKKYGYLPSLEGGNTYGFPGKLHEPKSGSTCTRFLIREPIRGIPENLIAKDENEENYFSDVVEAEYFGDLLLQVRKSKDENCHANIPNEPY
jgi:hypothetical protein